MFIPRIIPVLLLKDNGLVKTFKFKSPKYIGDPINAVRIFNDLKADELVFLDITASKEERCISKELVKDLGDEAFMPFAVGGGITELDQIAKLLRAGAEKVVLNTISCIKPNFVKEAAENFGNQSIAISIDIKKNIFNNRTVWIKDGTVNTRLEPLNYAKNMSQLGAGELIINSINHDGVMEGYDIDLISSISKVVPIPVVACGGAGSINDLKKGYFDGNANALAAGSIFVYHGRRKAVLINYPDKCDILKIFKGKSND
jgi:cyclase|tara:strand:- start:1333 stop:2109 length:777 start_codon:yes stop_codon:yes gene_type:complete